MKTRIGMRNIKTAVSVFICVLIFKIFSLGNPFYGAIAAIITMQNSPKSTFRVGRDRMMGTAAGAAIGLLFALIEPGNAVLCGLGIIATIYICNLLGWNSSVSIAGVVFMAIMVNLDGRSPVSYSTGRLIDTFIGIGVAFAVNSLIYPYDTGDKIYRSLSLLSEKLSVIAGQIICTGEKADLDSLNKAIWDLNNQLNAYNAEYKPRKRYDNKMDSIKSNLTVYNRVYHHLSVIQNMESRRALSGENIEKLKNLNFSCPPGSEYSESPQDIIYNYHIARVIEDLQSL